MSVANIPAMIVGSGARDADLARNPAAPARATVPRRFLKPARATGASYPRPARPRPRLRIARFACGMAVIGPAPGGTSRRRCKMATLTDEGRQARRAADREMTRDAVEA